MSKQQTAVELMAEQLPQVDWSDPFYAELLKKIKQMEKEQIEKAWWAGHDERDANHMIYPSEDCNQYYNETYDRTTNPNQNH